MTSAENVPGSPNTASRSTAAAGSKVSAGTRQAASDIRRLPRWPGPGPPDPDTANPDTADPDPPSPDTADPDPPSPGGRISSGEASGPAGPDGSHRVSSSSTPCPARPAPGSGSSASARARTGACAANG